MPLRLGVIADDLTGATDVANALVRAGMRVVQSIGVPVEPSRPHDAAAFEGADAVVVALKIRTAPAEQAVAEALQAARWLGRAGAEQFYLKYCSTFDSTAAGNIGPVTEALLGELGADSTLATPAFPQTGRTVFQGHLFVGDALLSDSGMRHHPLTPMTDANLVRVLQAQCTGRVGLVDHTVVRAGPAAIRQRRATLREAGVRVAIVDAVSDADLAAVGLAVAGDPLVTGASGVATALPAAWGFRPDPAVAELPAATGAAAVVAGSVSEATRGQVAAALTAGWPSYRVDPLRIAAGADVVAEAVAGALAAADGTVPTSTRLPTAMPTPVPRSGPGAGSAPPFLVYSTGAPEQVAQAQRQLGAAEAAGLVEAALGQVATALVRRPELGVARLIVAGGETAGAVCHALGVTRLRIGPQIDPGVPWCLAHQRCGDTLHLALKSGNFGGLDFFARAFALLA